MNFRNTYISIFSDINLMLDGALTIWGFAISRLISLTYQPHNWIFMPPIKMVYVIINVLFWICASVRNQIQTLTFQTYIFQGLFSYTCFQNSTVWSSPVGTYQQGLRNWQKGPDKILRFNSKIKQDTASSDKQLSWHLIIKSVLNWTIRYILIHVDLIMRNISIIDSAKLYRDLHLRLR